METTNTNVTPQGEVALMETQVQAGATGTNADSAEAVNTKPEEKEAATTPKQEEKKPKPEKQGSSPKKTEGDLDEDYKRRLEALEARELKADATELMKQEGLPLRCLDFVLKSDLEQTKCSIETFKQVFQEAVADAVKEKLKGTTPPQGDYGNTTAASTDTSIFAQALRG